jgi:ABC-type nitrate/sulfonate/bicarbonate transport system substrate-binding protein
MFGNRRSTLLMVFALLIVIVAVIAITSCTPKQIDTDKPIKVSIGTQRGMYSALAFVVKEKGYLEEEGLDPEWNWFTGSPQLLEAMKGGSIDIGLPVGSAPGQVACGNGSPIKIIANIVWGNEVLVMRKDVFDSISLNNPETLKGLSVATISKSSMQDYVARLWVENMGLDPETDFEFREVAAGAAQRSALLSGDIDIASTFEPHGTLLQNEGIGVIVGLGEEIAPNHDNTGLVVTQKILDNNRDVVVRTLRAIEKARIFANENPEEFYEIVAKYFEVDPAIVKASFENRIIVLPDNLRPGVEWYGKVGEFLDKWGYTLKSTNEYLPDYLNAWEEIHREAGLLQ